MAVTIQSDMMRAAELLPKTQRAPFLIALLDYGEYGREPEGKPAWLPAFEVCKERIVLSEEGRKKAKDMANKRWSKSKHDAAADAQASCTSIMHEHDAAADAQASSLDEMRLDEMRCDAMRAPARAREWCMEKTQKGFRVVDHADKGHSEPSESLIATYTSVHGSDAGFERVIRAMERPACRGCDRCEEKVIECHNTTRDALMKWDRPLDGDPSRIIGKMLREDVDNYG